MALAALFGEKRFLKNADSEDTVSVEEVSGEGKVLGLYFSAHWCPPCRAFTPQLAAWYKKVKETANGSNFEIVFVSSDKDEESFKEYFRLMPWLALPRSEKQVKDSLSKKFKIQGIPMLVLLDAGTGKTITKDGRAVVVEDPLGIEFPWKQKTVEEIIAQGSLINNLDVETSWKDLEGEAIGLYFSAHWCGPCRVFTPQLVETYKAINKEKKKFEIIFVSSDRDEESMKEYFKDMPWLALRFEDNRKKALSRCFNVEGIPTLVILDKNGEIINKQGRKEVCQDEEGKAFPWYPKPVQQFSPTTAGDVNDSPCLLWYSKEDKSAAIKTTLEEIAKKYKEAYKNGRKVKDEEVLFFYFCWEPEDPEKEELWGGIMNFLSFHYQEESLFFLNIPSQEKYYHEGEVNASAIEKILDDFDSDKLECTKISN